MGQYKVRRIIIVLIVEEPDTYESKLVEEKR